jgi:hypothetical protein
MNKRMDIIKVLSLSLMLIFPFPSISAPEAGETVIKRGTVNDDYYAAGGMVDVDANIVGDITVFGGELFIGKKVQGDVMALGGAINIRGEIQDDIRTMGGDINIDAGIRDDLIAAGGKVRVSSTTSVGGEAWLAGGDVFMAGVANQGLSIKAGNIRLSGTIHGDVNLEGGEIEVLEDTLIKGNLNYKSPSEAKIHSSAKIIGKTTYEYAEWDDHHGTYGVLFSLTMIIAAIVLFKLFPGFTLSSARRISADPWKSLGVGFGLLVITPIIAVLLMGIVLGVWVGLGILAFYFVSLLLAFLIGCFFVGDWGAKMFNKNITTTGHRLVSVSVVIVLLGIIQLIPVLGALLTFALLLLGLGAGMLQLHSVYHQFDSV